MNLIPFARDPYLGARPLFRQAGQPHGVAPAAQRKMVQRAGATTAEAPGSDTVYVSNPRAAAKLIQQAAANVQKD